MEDPFDDDNPVDEDLEDPPHITENTGSDPPSIFISLSQTNEIVLGPINAGHAEDLQRLSASCAPLKTRPPSPSFTPGSLFRKFSHPRSPRASTQSIESVDESLPEQTDNVEAPDYNVPDIPFLESQMLYFFELVSKFSKKKMLSIMTNSWIIESPNEKCDDSGNTLVHVASLLEETKVLYSLISLNANLNVLNSTGNSALHFAVQKNNVQMVKMLVENRAETEVIDQTLKLNPLQCAALKLNEDVLKYLLKHGAEYRVVSRKNQTILHLACLSVVIRLSELRERLNKIEYEEEDMSPDSILSHGLDTGDFPYLENKIRTEEEIFKEETFPILKLLLKFFEFNPIDQSTQERLIDLEDDIITSPGTILHYFCAINYVEGVQMLLQEPFLCDPNVENKNKFSPILIAAKENNFDIVNLLLEFHANPNSQDPLLRMTPLHLILSKYHISRRNQTCTVIQNLMSAGADPKIVNAGGEAPAHIVVQIQDIQMMACFLDFLNKEDMNIKDFTGDSLLHYAAGCMDEDAIFKVMNAGANIMCRLVNMGHYKTEPVDQLFQKQDMHL